MCGKSDVQVAFVRTVMYHMEKRTRKTFHKFYRNWQKQNCVLCSVFTVVTSSTLFFLCLVLVFGCVFSGVCVPSKPEAIDQELGLTVDMLKVGMRLRGVVRNVVSFGSFVDIGVHDDGLLHVRGCHLCRSLWQAHSCEKPKHRHTDTPGQGLLVSLSKPCHLGRTFQFPAVVTHMAGNLAAKGRRELRSGAFLSSFASLLHR